MKLKEVKQANLNNWYEKPPRIIANLGDALHAVSLFALGYAAIKGIEWLAIIFIIIGAIGIFIQKLFSEND